MPNDDRDLLEQWSKKGDGDAFGALVSRYGAMVYSACRRILGNPTDAEDITQECFEALATAGTKPGAYVGAWLHRVATYHAISHIRSDIRRKERETLYTASRNSETVVEWKDIYGFIDEAIEALPEKLRRPLVAHFLEGQTKEAVAHALGVSRQLASHRIERGLEQVRATLRRKGVTLGGTVLASLLGANASEAAPATLITRLGKIALTGPGVTAPVAAAAAVRAATRSVAHIGVLKTTGSAALVAATVALAIAMAWKEIKRPYPTQNITAASTFSVSKHIPAEERLPIASVERSQDVVRHVDNSSASPANNSTQVLEPGVVIYGTVLDESARPVPNATVTLDNHENMEEQQYRWETIGTPAVAHDVALQQTTNAQGEFAFERVPTDGRRGESALVLAAEAGGHCAAKIISAMYDGRRRRVDLVLTQAGVVRGTIINGKNAGVQGALVRINSRQGEMSNITYITKGDGSFESRPLPQGVYELMVVAIGYLDPERLQVRPDGTNTVIRLERKPGGGSISGYVVSAEDGQRMPGIAVKCAALPVVTSDPNGEFGFEDVQPGSLAVGISATSAPYTTVDQTVVNLKPGQRLTGVELKVTRGFTVSGQVLSPDTRRPVAHANLVFRLGKPGYGAQTMADDGGQFTVAQLSPGDYQVRLVPPNSLWEGKTTPLTVRGNMDDVQLFAEPFRAARGTVVNGTGAAVAGASVAVIDADSFSRLICVADAAGVFELAIGEKTDSFYLQAYGDGCISKRYGPVGPGSHTELRLEDAGAIEGLVVDTAGRPVADAIVVAVPEQSELITALNADGSQWNPIRGASGVKARTSKNGAFVLDPVLPGKMRLEVYLPSSTKGYPLAETNVTLHAGETLSTKLVLDLSGYGAIEGIVTQDSAPLPCVIVSAYGAARDWVAAVQTQTDANGNYRIPNVRSGDIQVTAATDSRTSKNQTIQLAEGEMQTVNFDFEQHDGGIEGYFTVNGKPATAFVSAKTSGTDSGGTRADAITDGKGYYRIANLAEGKYAVLFQNVRSQGSAIQIPSETIVEVSTSEFARCDLALETGQINGTVAGLRLGEKAGVGLFPGAFNVQTLLTLSTPTRDEAMLAYMEATGSGEFQFGDIPAGTYTVGVVALPAGRSSAESDLATSLASGRYAAQSIEVVAGKPSTIDITLPKK